MQDPFVHIAAAEGAFTLDAFAPGFKRADPLQCADMNDGGSDRPDDDTTDQQQRNGNPGDADGAVPVS
jgi:hypothetical protein